MTRPPPKSTLFPYTPLFRSNENPRTITAVTILDRGAERIERELSDQPAVQARLTATIARAYNNLGLDRKSTRLNSSHANISYAVFCLKKKKQITSTCTMTRT